MMGNKASSLDATPVPPTPPSLESVLRPSRSCSSGELPPLPLKESGSLSELVGGGGEEEVEVPPPMQPISEHQHQITLLSNSSNNTTTATNGGEASSTSNMTKRVSGWSGSLDPRGNICVYIIGWLLLVGEYDAIEGKSW
jgi:hypothetical protein